MTDCSGGSQAGPCSRTAVSSLDGQRPCVLSTDHVRLGCLDRIKVCGVNSSSHRRLLIGPGDSPGYRQRIRLVSWASNHPTESDRPGALFRFVVGSVADL